MPLKSCWFAEALFSTRSCDYQHHSIVGKLPYRAAQTQEPITDNYSPALFYRAFFQTFTMIYEFSRMGMDMAGHCQLIGEKTGLTGFIDTQGTRYNFDRVFP